MQQRKDLYDFNEIIIKDMWKNNYSHGQQNALDLKIFFDIKNLVFETTTTVKFHLGSLAFALLFLVRLCRTCCCQSAVLRSAL